MKCRSADINFWKCIPSLVDSQTWCERGLLGLGYNRKIGTAGVIETVFTSEELNIQRTKGEKKFRWIEPDTYAPLTGQATHDNIVFVNWDGNDECGLRNVAFTNNIFSNDTFKHHIFSNVRWSGYVRNGGEFYATRTYGDAHYPTSERAETYFGLL